MIKRFFTLMLRRIALLLLFAFFVIFLGVESGYAGKVAVATWNVKEGSVENLAAKAEAIRQAGRKIRPDVLVIQEINSFSSAQLIAQYMNMGKVHIAVSNFGSDAEIIFFGFEVAVISKIPIVSVHEYQPTWKDHDGNIKRNTDGPITIDPKHGVRIRVNEDISDLIVPPDIITDARAREASPSRGILRVELANGLVIYPVHLKSNLVSVCGAIGRDTSKALATLGKISRSFPKARPKVDEAVRLIRSVTRGRNNTDSVSRRSYQEQEQAIYDGHAETAQKRENAVAAIAKLAATDISNNLTVVIAGDFNTPLEEPSKRGNDLGIDCVPRPLSCTSGQVPHSCATMDGFDDTHYILQSGKGTGNKFRPLFTKAETTYAGGKNFAQSPIDNIYIGGKYAARARAARKIIGSGDPSFRSDHFPLKATINLP